MINESVLFLVRILKIVPAPVKAVGIASFFINVSTLMVYSIFGLYMSKNLGINMKKLGFLDGAIEGFSFTIKIFSGVLSDFLLNRKLLMITGAFFLFIAKPIEAMVTSYSSMFFAKILERFGNGIQATPRDAVVGDWSPKNIKGACFGIRQALAAFGSVVGAVLSWIIFKQTDGNFRTVFWSASIPSLLAILVIFFLVKDKKHKNPINIKLHNNKKRRIIFFKDIKNLGPEYWIIIGIASTYMMAKVTESIVILHILQKLKLPDYWSPICMICYQIANSFTAFPLGALSDKLKNRDKVILFGIVVFLISDLLFVYSNNIFTMIIALFLFGTYVGISQSIFQAKIIDIVPVDLKGTSIGIFNFTCAISLVVGGTLAGYIANKYSTSTSFVISSFLAIFAILMFVILKTIFFKRLSIHKQ
jgi:MFS family permease